MNLKRLRLNYEHSKPTLNKRIYTEKASFRYNKLCIRK